MSLISRLKGNGPSGFGSGSTADQVTAGLDLSGKRYLVTGCNSGLGAEVMRVLTSRGAEVLGTGRTIERAKEACSALKGAVPIACELSDPTSVRACVAEVQTRGPLDGIIANAGIMALPKLEVRHGLELQFLTNHMGHFLLVTGLLSSLNEQGRVVMLSSSAHKMAPKGGINFDNLDGSRGYSPWSFYGQSKLSNLLFAKALARRLPKATQTANAVHPGVISTGLQRSMNPVMAAALQVMGPIFLKDVPEGAATEVFVATHPSLATVRGEYFADCNVASPSADANDMALGEKLWVESERLAASFQ